MRIVGYYGTFVDLGCSSYYAVSHGHSVFTSDFGAVYGCMVIYRKDFKVSGYYFASEGCNFSAFLVWVDTMDFVNCYCGN